MRGKTPKGKTMSKICISHNNSKLGADIPSVSMPVGVTCRPDAPCFAKCYARKGNMARPNVKAAYTANYEIYKKDPAFFFHYVAVMTRFNRFFRWHSAGYIVDDEYFQGMISVALENPETKYLAFTKKFDIVNRYLDAGNALPQNLRIVFSGWDKNFRVDNPHNLPTTYVRFKDGDNSAIPEDAIPCAGKCYECVACWQLEKGQSIYFDEH